MSTADEDLRRVLSIQLPDGLGNRVKTPDVPRGLLAPTGNRVCICHANCLGCASGCYRPVDALPAAAKSLAKTLALWLSHPHGRGCSRRFGALPRIRSRDEPRGPAAGFAILSVKRNVSLTLVRMS